LTERQHIERMKDEFLATVSHEFRTPLTSILGSLALLASGAAGALPETAIKLAEVARRNGERLGRLIDDVLDLTKLEGNRMMLHMRSARVDDLLHEALAANQGYAQRAGITLKCDIEDNGLKVRLDSDRFLQVMANLLSNAIKHSTRGDTVTVTMDCSGTNVRVSIRDQGPGIDPDFRTRIFEKFSQADGSDRRPLGGTGLGLYITRMLVERMGGRVDVTSTSSLGTTFSLDLPIADISAAVEPVWILHIDSDLDSRRKVADWLSPLCVVESAADSDQVKSLFLPNTAPIIIGDPKAQGSAEDFCAMLRRLSRGLPVILYSDSVNGAFARQMGFTWLRKSRASQAQLIETLRAAMAQASQRQTHE
jgi:two-component sensor histidine kinase